MDKIACMRMFCRVVKEGGFSAAARSLGSSKVAVSRSVSALEADLGLRLLQRTTRKMHPTDDGLAYYERCQALLDDFDELEHAIKDRGEQVKGKLRVSLPSESFSQRHLQAFFVEFARSYPDLDLELHLADRYVNIVEEGFDAAIRIGQLEDSSLIARKLADMEIYLCASPGYLQQHAQIDHPQDIQTHDLVADSNHRSGQSCLFQQGEQRIAVQMESRIRVNSSQSVVDFLKQGFGLGVCPSFMVQEEIQRGELQRVLADWVMGRGGIYLVYSHRKHLSGKLRALAESLNAYFDNKGQ